MKPITIEHMDLKQIADSGQCFTWRELSPGRYAIEAFGRCLEAEQKGNQFFFSCDEEEFEEVWRDYFDLNTDYGRLKEQLDPEDAYLRAAAEYGWGIRVLRQDLWEVMVCFLISQNNNITRIRNSIRGLCETYGQRRETEYCAFPQPDELTEAAAADFERLGLGYRAKYLKALVENMKDGGLEQLRQKLSQADDEAAREELMSIYGIGKKVADCICLFGLHRQDMFPADTHINKVVNTYYNGSFPFGRYQGMLGVIQQYLFYYDLK